MNILYLGLPEKPTHWLRILYDDFVEAAANRFDIRIFDFTQPTGPQFNGINAVVEAGGAFANREMIRAAAGQGVKLWQVVGTGMDHVDVPYFHEMGIPLANLPGSFSGVALAEHVLFMILHFEKQYAATRHSLRNRILCQPVSGELTGKKLGLVGFGASARELAQRAACLGMDVSSIDQEPVPETLLRRYKVNSIAGPDCLAELLANSDYVSLHLPLTASTRHMIDSRALATMKPDAILINVARSEIVDEEALITALRENRIRGAGLDVFSREPVDPEHPLLQMENVLATPHTAGVTVGTSRRRGRATVENLLRIAEGLGPSYLYPLPSTPKKKVNQ